MPGGRFAVNPGGQHVTRYTYAQLEGLWINAGGSRATAPVAAAVAEAESGGFSGATSSNPDGGTNVGLWQLDTRGKGAGHTVADLKDPAMNARLAVKGSAGGKDWSAWSTFGSGAYRRFLSPKTAPNMNVPGGAGPSTSSSGSAQTDTCLIAVPQILFAGGGCVFSKTNARALIGGLVLAAGGFAVVTGMAVLVAGAFSGTELGQKAGSVAEGAGAGIALIPGAEAVGAGVAAAGKGVKSYSGHVQRRRQQGVAEERKMQRQLGEPRENRGLREGRGAIRETPAGTRRRERERIPF